MPMFVATVQSKDKEVKKIAELLKTIAHARSVAEPRHDEDIDCWRALIAQMREE